ncbi:hypothetical protein ABDK00_003010 [Niabella insulamsoli]|uniref:hypothetical protein n=1 Tax=Niabella insulamsoli TaxID=3144874 RepID=UPI0031FD09FD
MRKISPNAVVLLLLFIISLISCKKTYDSNAELTIPGDAIGIEKKIGLKLLAAARGVDIRAELMTQSIANSEKTDYHIKLNELVSQRSVSKNAILPRSVIASDIRDLSALSGALQNIKNGNSPVIFYPRSEVMQHRINRAKNNAALGFAKISISDVKQALEVIRPKPGRL